MTESARQLASFLTGMLTAFVVFSAVDASEIPDLRDHWLEVGDYLRAALGQADLGQG